MSANFQLKSAGTLAGDSWQLNIIEGMPTAPDGFQPVWSDAALNIYKHLSGRVCFEFPALASFDVDLSKETIRVCAAAAVSSHTLRHLFLDQVSPRLVSRGENLVLHAAGVDIHGQAVLFVGPTGRGKSTLAASFHVAGFPLIGDDAIIIAKESSIFACRAVYRSLRLFPDSLKEVLPDARELTPVSDYIDKSNVGGLGEQGSTRSLPLGAIFFLSDSDYEGIRIEQIGGAAACMAVAEQSFAIDPTDAVKANDRLQLASGLIDRIPIYRLDYPRDYNGLPAVREAIFSALHQARRRLLNSKNWE